MENMNNEERENLSEDSSAVDENNFAYKNVLGGKQNSRIYSIISICLSGLSVLLSVFSWAGLILGLLGILFAIISRKNIGYFDKISIAGIIVGIFGAVFAVMGILFAYVFEESGMYKSFMDLFGNGESNAPLAIEKDINNGNYM